MIVDTETITPQELVEFIRESSKRLWPPGAQPFDTRYDGILCLMPTDGGIAAIRSGNGIADVHIKIAVQQSEELSYLRETVSAEDKMTLLLNSMRASGVSSSEELAEKLQLVREAFLARSGR